MPPAAAGSGRRRLQRFGDPAPLALAAPPAPPLDPVRSAGTTPLLEDDTTMSNWRGLSGLSEELQQKLTTIGDLEWREERIPGALLKDDVAVRETWTNEVGGLGGLFHTLEKVMARVVSSRASSSNEQYKAVCSCPYPSNQLFLPYLILTHPHPLSFPFVQLCREMDEVKERLLTEVGEREKIDTSKISQEVEKLSAELKKKGGLDEKQFKDKLSAFKTEFKAALAKDKDFTAALAKDKDFKKSFYESNKKDMLKNDSPFISLLKEALTKDDVKALLAVNAAAKKGGSSSGEAAPGAAVATTEAQNKIIKERDAAVNREGGLLIGIKQLLALVVGDPTKYDVILNLVQSLKTAAYPDASYEEVLEKLGLKHLEVSDHQGKFVINRSVPFN
jgi:hypothetical protein